MTEELRPNNVALDDEPASGAPEPSPWLRAFAVLVAIAGGCLGIGGALIEELQHATLAPLGAVLMAPMIEEALKPAGIYILLVRWPSAAGGRLSTTLLTALSGLTFGIVESVVYVTIYFPDAGDSLILYRFSVTLVLHTVASLLVGMGLSRSIIDWAAGHAPLPKRTRNFYLAAVVLHATYNLSALVLAIAGVLDVD